MPSGSSESKDGGIHLDPEGKVKRKIERGIYSPIVDGAEAESKVRDDAVVGCHGNQYEVGFVN